MDLDRGTLNQLKRFATAFREARERQANESDTVLFLCKFFEDVLGYDSLKGEISKEVAVRDRYCDIALKIEGAIRILVEAKSAGQLALSEKHIEQAENYASRSGLQWVLLTNGVLWRLYHVTFAEGEGINHDLAFEVNLLEEIEKDAKALWARIGLLHRAAVKKDELETYWQHRKALSPTAVVKVLLREDVLKYIRRELRREAGLMPELKDVFAAVRDALSKEALAEAGELGSPLVRKRRKPRVVASAGPAEADTQPTPPTSPSAGPSAPHGGSPNS